MRKEDYAIDRRDSKFIIYKRHIEVTIDYILFWYQVVWKRLIRILSAFFIKFTIDRFLDTQNMQSQRTSVSKRPNSKQRETRAIVNLRQLSDTPWLPLYQQKTTNQPNNSQTLQQTNESQQLPLNPKRIQQNNIKPFFQSLLKPRPNTIQNLSPDSSNYSKRHHIKQQPLTSINFYQKSPPQYNTIDASSKLNSEIQLFASRIKQQGKLIQEIQSSRAKSKGIKQETTAVSFKSHIAQKSLLYKQVKNYLYQSFKIDGKPVEIKWDRYSIESHGLPKRKSIYSFKNHNNQNLLKNHKTDILLKKVHRYTFQDEQKDDKTIKRSSGRKKSISLNDENPFRNTMQTLQLRENSKKKAKGKLWLGRPPTTFVLEQNQN